MPSIDRMDSRALSVVPYQQLTSREVVLRHNDAVVVYEPQSERLVLRNASQTQLDLTICPTCHQPLRGERRNGSQEYGGPESNRSGGFVHRDYFRLHQSLYGSPMSTAPPSPRRRLVEPVRPHEGSPRNPEQRAYVDSPPASPAAPPGISETAFSPGYFQRCYVVEKELGKGGKGVVFLVTHLLDGNEIGHFACKRVPVGDDREWLKNVLIEVQLLQQLEHKHLVRYHHVWLEDVKLSNFGPSVPCAFILQQYCNAGDLHDYVLDSARRSTSPHHLKERVRRRSKNQPELPLDLSGRKLPLEEIYSFFKDITSGLNHLHINGYIHRDLKPSNCLLHDDGTGERSRVLVSDFGEVQVEEVVRKSTGATGTISFCAPEVLRLQSSGVYGNFTRKSDIFSLGMILYFLCFARLPYSHADILNEENEDLDQLRDEITTWSGLHEERKLRPDLPEQLYTFLRRLLSLDPEERPTAEAILLGIKTNSGLDRISDSRPRSAGLMFEDLRSDSRISPVDSPRPSTQARKMSTGFSRPGGPGQLRLSSSHKERIQSPTSPVGERESGHEEAMSPGGSLVLSRQYPSPTKLGMAQLTAPPAPRSPFPKVDLSGQLARRILKIFLLLLKVISVNLSCAPTLANPTVAYFLLGLAVLDLISIRSGLGTSTVLVVLHVASLLAASWGGVLCVSGMDYWQKV
ncbi:MAG: putative serine/threonine-protein kinase iks1 [Alectoria fallacina]|uniref:non-specific serine/threonine protein kinase n=1 Tax=Alectoria fallacina TaxID=1903189 RepID=A0A8H3JB04_9LECA|nr:MAG: putative serine/threonine-protein kinase iks1 [Alectoria fallacina]